MAKRSSIIAWIALAALAAAVVALLCMRGCSRRPAGDDRTKDPEYIQSLKDVRAAQKPLVRARHKTVSEMEAIIAKARQALPSEASDEAVKAELEGHPEKYPEWKGLNERIAADNAAIEGNLKDAQARVRARILKQLGTDAKPPVAAGDQVGKKK